MFLVESKAKKFTTTLGEFMSWYVGEDDVTKLSKDDFESTDLLYNFNGDTDSDTFKDDDELMKWIKDNKDTKISVSASKDYYDFIATFNLPGLKGKSVELVCMDDPYEAFK